jgi:hypothetical protein
VNDTRHRPRRTVALLAAAAVVSTALAADAPYPGMQPLTGQFDIAGATAVDPPPDEPRDTHLRVYLTGDSARALYEHMKVSTGEHPCGDPEGLSKTIGGMTCVRRRSDGGHECWFAIDIAAQRIDSGWAC